MKISGREIASEIKENLKKEVEAFKEKGIIPKIAILTLGPEGAWETYVRQKLKVAEEIGITAVFINLEDSNEEKLLKTIKELDSDPSFHGIIVQRPLPQNIDRQKTVDSISSAKDVDGFRQDSNFGVPLWLAVKDLILASFKELNIREDWKSLIFVVIGKGETAGGPVISGLRNLGANPEVIDSKTQNPDEILKNADVIVSSVGKTNTVKAEQLKKGAILIGVGLHSENGKAIGDYDETEIENVAGAYTPTPGGVGPLNLAYLYKNLIEAAKKAKIPY